MNDDQYIEMCKAAGEIQGLWLEQLTTGDATDNGIVVGFGGFKDDDSWDLELDDDRIMLNTKCLDWLPTQKDLDCMASNLDGVKVLPNELISSLNGFCSNLDFLSRYKSMESLKLAYVMNLLYAKYWNFEKKEWVQ